MSAQRVERWLRVATALYALAMFVLTVVPIRLPPSEVDPKRLSLHFIEFALLGTLLGITLRPLRTVLLVGISYGIFLETIQLALPYRHFDLADLLANGAGAVLGSVAVLRCRTR